MASGAHRTSRLAYPGTLAMLGLALAFPIALMVFNPTLMFERGWEQYVGTAIYFWAVLTLAKELHWLWKNESAFEEAPALLKTLSARKSVAGDRAGPHPRPTLMTADSSPAGSANSSATSRRSDPRPSPS